MRRQKKNCIFFGGLEWVTLGHSFSYVAHFVFERRLDSNPESCRSKQARYQQPPISPDLAIHLP
jgi:hypothetical protein